MQFDGYVLGKGVSKPLPPPNTLCHRSRETPL